MALQRKDIRTIDDNDRKSGLRMKQITNQATNQQRLSRKGGDTGIKERILSRILTVCCIKGMTLMIEIRDYRGGDYEHEKAQRQNMQQVMLFGKMETSNLTNLTNRRKKNDRAYTRN